MTRCNFSLVHSQQQVHNAMELAVKNRESMKITVAPSRSAVVKNPDEFIHHQGIMCYIQFCSVIIVICSLSQTEVSSAVA